MVGGRRYLLGSTAFFTLASAQRSKLGILRKAAACTLPDWHQAGRAAGFARAQLAEYDATGTLH